MSKASSTLAQKRLDGAVMRGRKRIEQTQQQALAKQLRAYFLGMAQRLKLPTTAEKNLHYDRITLKVRELKADPAGFPSADSLLSWSVEEQKLTSIVHKAYINVADEVVAGVAANVGVVLDFNIAQEFDKDILKDVAAGVKDINIGTRSAVAGTVRRGLQDGSSPATIAKNLVAQIEGWGGGKNGDTVAHSRAMVVARTETAIAYNRSAILAFEKSGIITKTKVLDAPDCGWTSHDDPDLANGKIVDFAAARLHPVAHPNCVRAFSPVVAKFDEAPPAAQPSAAPKTAPKPVNNYVNPYKAPLAEQRFDSDAFRIKVDAWSQANLSLPVGTLTTAERDALLSYQGFGYQAVNMRLRGVAIGQVDTGVVDAKAEEIARAIDKARLPRAVQVQRGVNYDAFGVTNGTELDALVGTTVQEPAFLSTSLGSGFEKQVTIVLKAPKGSKGIYMGANNTGGQTYTIAGHTVTGPELEILFQRGSKIRIDRVVRGNGDYSPNGRTVYATLLE